MHSVDQKGGKSDVSISTVIKYRIYRTSKKKKLKQSRNRPGVAQKVPGSLGSQIP
jgi:hypothetical protein